MNIRRFILVSVLALGFISLSMPAAATPAAAPCSGLRLADDQIRFEQPLPAALPLSEAAMTCLRAAAAELAERPTLRAVTVVARLPDEQRIAGQGLQVARAAAAVLAEKGVAPSMISAVAPAIGHDQPAGLFVAYREFNARRPVGILGSVTGQVDSGIDLDGLEQASPGATLTTNTVIRTGPDSYAFLYLVDGSILRMQADSLIRIKRLVVNRKLEREVHIGLLRGELMTVARLGGDGSIFRIETRTAVAGVRGTEFRTALDGRGGTRVETLGGGVGLDSRGTEVVVDRGFGSLADAGRPPSPPRPLLPSADIRSPRSGRFAAPPSLRWQPVADATAYRVEFARDADFSLEFSQLSTRSATAA
ncbi:MAG: FecR family protein, partial [Myxococcota bacterium]